MRAFTFYLLLTALAPALSHAAGSDCAKAKPGREQTVCSDSKLSLADTRLTAAYVKTRSVLSPASAAAVQADQRDWLAWVDKVCAPTKARGPNSRECFANEYTMRLRELTTDVVRVDGMQFYARAHFVFVPSPKPPQDEFDPGFGYGEFTWPQIDNPTPVQQAWNDFAHNAVLRTVCCGRDEKKQVKPLEAVVDNQGYIYGLFGLISANRNLIDFNVDVSTYEWGGAHPGDTLMSYAWQVAAGKQLQASDVFSGNSGWQTALAALVLSSLRKNPGADALWTPGPYVEPHQLEDAVADGVVHPDQWSLSSKGLAITFGEYAVGPYAIGMPSATIPWSALASYLAPTFKTSDLPALIVGSRR